ncbi:MAG: hypothetical protein FJ027_10840 [Candidatus Rokubacteria bacterium]|nr:hypothetical protein [Candidatus Rokubacteria bacterium]
MTDDTRATERGKRPYEPPRIVSEPILETTALACGKVQNTTGNCNMRPAS